MDETSGSQTDAQQAPGPVGLTEQQLDELRAMFDVARSGDVRLAEWVDQGLPVNLTNESGDTLLILACYHRHHDLAAALVARGADLERVNERGQTALGCAVFRQDEALVSMLLEAGADPDTGGQSARSIAHFFGLKGMSHLLDGPRGAGGEALR